MKSPPTICATGPSSASALVVSATFTAEPLRETFAFWLRRLGIDLPIRFAPYNQVFQQLLDQSSMLAQNRGGINVVLARLEDWVRFRRTREGTLESLEGDVRHLVECLRSASESFPSPLVVAACPSSPAFLGQPGYAEFEARMMRAIESELEGLKTVYFAGLAEMESLYPVGERHDPHGDELGHVPYTPEYFTALGTFLARKAHALRLTPYKVVALDCDDTLWRGICGEDGPEGVVLDPPRRALQEFMAAQQNAGMLLCLCSKNNMEDVIETFRAHPEMPLKLEDFVARRINWTAKSTNLASLAEELELGLDSFIFIDDNAKECGEVQARRPEVLTLPLPADAEEIPAFLRHVWAFDRLRVTEEDKRRGELYAQKAERSRLEKQAKTLEEFIQSLQLEIQITPLAPEDLPRAAQLTHRTNQMNFTTIRRTEAEIQSLLAAGEAECLVVKVSDRFGSYGLTGLAIFRAGGGALRVDTFLLSCRVLGRGVEHRVMARLGEIAEERRLERVEVPFSPTQRNQPALMFLESVGARFKVRAENGVRFDLPAAEARRVAYKPSAPAPRQARESVEERPEAREQLDYAGIAAQLRTVSQIQQQVAAARQGLENHVTPDDAPRSALEAELAALWAELLRAPAVGVHQNFFDLGGHSLLAVQLLSRVRQAYQVDLPLDVVYSSAFTIAELAKAIEVRLIESAGAEAYGDILAEIENLSDEEVRELLARETAGTGNPPGD